MESVPKDRLLINGNHSRQKPEEERRPYFLPLYRSRQYQFIFQLIKLFKERIPKRYANTLPKKKGTISLEARALNAFTDEEVRDVP